MRYTYYSKSSQLFFIGSIALFITKGLSFAITFLPEVSASGTKFFTNITEIAYYGFLVLAFLALNGEGVCYKRNREFVRKKSVSRLKRLVVFCFLGAFAKALANATVMNVSKTGAFGIAVRALCAFFLAAASLSFVLLSVSAHCFKRDRRFKKLRVFEAAALAVAVVYYVLRYVSLLKGYEVSLLPDGVYNAVCSSNVLNVFCILQYFADALMFGAAYKTFGETAADEEKETEKNNEATRKCETLFSESGCGIDNFDDLYIPHIEEGESGEGPSLQQS